jgi:hypothetical protein
LNHNARYALETMPGAAVDQALRDCVPRLSGRPLLGVIGSLGVRRDVKAVKLLSKFLSDPTPAVVQSAARALGQIGNADAAQALHHALAHVAPTNRLDMCEGYLRCEESLAARHENHRALAIADELCAMKDLPGQLRAGAVRAAIVLRGKSGASLLMSNLSKSDHAAFIGAIRATLELPDLEISKTLAASSALAAIRTWFRCCARWPWGNRRKPCAWRRFGRSRRLAARRRWQ